MYLSYKALMHCTKFCLRSENAFLNVWKMSAENSDEKDNSTDHDSDNDNDDN